MLLLMSSRPSYFDDFTFVREKSGTTMIVDKALRKLLFFESWHLLVQSQVKNISKQRSRTSGSIELVRPDLATPKLIV